MFADYCTVDDTSPKKMILEMGAPYAATTAVERVSPAHPKLLLMLGIASMQLSELRGIFFAVEVAPHPKVGEDRYGCA